MRDYKRLVVDASIARAAGGRENPTSQRCSDFLVSMRDETNHHLVMTPDIFVEWDKHEALFAYRWRTSMITRQKVSFFKPNEIINPDLRTKVEELNVDDGNRRELMKDIHLLEAALAADQIVSSLNSKDRKRFAGVCIHLEEIKHIAWINPDKTEENCSIWLKEGAEHEPHRCLGFSEE